MCGRYTLTANARAIRDALPSEVDFETDPALTLAPRFNIAPTQIAPILVFRGDRLRLEPSRWGLVPIWMWKRAGEGRTPTKRVPEGFINARVETAPNKPSFRSAFRARHCLVPATGFYEWQQTASGKQPYFVRMVGEDVARRDQAELLMFMAGLYEPCPSMDEGQPVPAPTSFTILTMDADAAMRPIHERMPVILASDALLTWLCVQGDKGELTSEGLDLDALHLRHRLEPFAVSKRVNSPSVDEAALIAPLDVADLQ